jgi:uncharacterized membrane protein
VQEALADISISNNSLFSYLNSVVTLLLSDILQDPMTWLGGTNEVYMKQEHSS